MVLWFSTARAAIRIEKSGFLERTNGWKTAHIGTIMCPPYRAGCEIAAAGNLTAERGASLWELRPGTMLSAYATAVPHR